MPSPFLLTTLGFFLLLPHAVGYNWSSLPVQQCSNLIVTVAGADFLFPLKALVVPVGPSPLRYEVRKVIEVAFPTNSTTVSFPLPYPAGSGFVVLVSDRSGFPPWPQAIGNISTHTVSPSDNSPCFDDTRDAVNPFSFALSPRDVAECRDLRIYWNSASVKGTTSFLAVIPGPQDGKFTRIPFGKVDTRWVVGTGFTWTPAVRAGTNLIIVGGDNRGMGAGGFISNVVNPGNPASAVFGDCPRSAPQNTTPSSGTVVVGIIGGVAALGLLYFILYRLLRTEMKPKVVVVPEYESPAPSLVNYGGNRYPRVSTSIPKQPGSGNTKQETRWQPLVYVNAVGTVSNGGQQWPKRSVEQGGSRNDAVHITWDGRTRA